MSNVVQQPTLEAFFFEEIEQVQERSGKTLPTEVEAYVVHLLARFARKTQEAGRASRPLAIDYMTARAATGSARAYALRGVGDRALYISGVVPRSLQRTPVDVRYVQGIGSAAYREIAGAGPLAVLGLLAERFAEVADVIGDVVEIGGEREDDLLAVYERWRRHGDPRDLKLLLHAGVLVDPEGTDVMQ